MTDFKIIQGHALDVLRTLETESIQSVICSPPYYGLRSYGTPPVIWNNHNGCAHNFGAAIPFAKQDNRTAEQKAAQGANVGSNINFNEKTTTATSGSFCLSCNAWRGGLGLEPTFQLYISHLIDIFREVKRVLRKDGTCFVNLGDSFVGAASETPSKRDDSPIAKGTVMSQEIRSGRSERHKAQIAYGLRPKSLMNIPARFAIAMTDELKMIQRNEIIWHKPACMPSSAKDRFTVDFEPIFFFAKNPKYKFNQQLEPTAPITPIRLAQNVAAQAGSVIVGGGYHEPMKAVGDPENRNKRTVWRINFEPQSEEHYASYPTKLVEPMILAGTDEGDMVLDIFNGTATTGITALRNRRQYIGIELNESYIEISKRRLAEIQVNLF